jgi:hypothetical protein
MQHEPATPLVNKMDHTPYCPEGYGFQISTSQEAELALSPCLLRSRHSVQAREPDSGLLTDSLSLPAPHFHLQRARSCPVWRTKARTASRMGHLCRSMTHGTAKWFHCEK